MKSCSFHSKPHIFTANPLISEQTPCFQSKPLIFIANRLAIQWLAMKDLLFKYLQFWRNFFSKQTGLRSAVCAKTGGWLSAVGYERFVIQILAILEEFFFQSKPVCDQRFALKQVVGSYYPYATSVITYYLKFSLKILEKKFFSANRLAIQWLAIRGLL